MLLQHTALDWPDLSRDSWMASHLVCRPLEPLFAGARALPVVQFLDIIRIRCSARLMRYHYCAMLTAGA